MTKRAYTVLTCDRCGREKIKDIENKGYPEGWAVVLVRDNQWSGKDEKKDLCTSCMVSLHELLQGVR